MNNPNPAEYYDFLNDLVKILVPGVIGLLAGLLPYLFERQKIKYQLQQDNAQANRQLLSSFTDALAGYIGSSKAYLSCLLASKGHHLEGDQPDLLYSKYADLMLDNEVARVKAKAICGLIGSSSLLDALLEYDRALSDKINFLSDNYNPSMARYDELSDVAFAKERQLLNALNSLNS